MKKIIVLQRTNWGSACASWDEYMEVEVEVPDPVNDKSTSGWSVIGERDICNTAIEQVQQLKMNIACL